MNIDNCIEVCNGIKAGKNIDFRAIGKVKWHDRNTTSLPDFDNFEYRIAPDVVYKIVRDGTLGYATEIGCIVGADYVQGHWVEGDPA